MDDPLVVKQEIIEDDPLDTKQCSVVLVKQEMDDYLNYVEPENDYLDEVEDEEFEENPIYGEEDLESSTDEEEGEDESDSEYVYKSKKRKKEKVQNGENGISCHGCQRTFQTQANLNKHLGHFKKCRNVYEESGELPTCFTTNKRTYTGTFNKYKMTFNLTASKMGQNKVKILLNKN